MNVNQQLIRPAAPERHRGGAVPRCRWSRCGRYSEEKRSGTIELLLTSPLTDFQIVIGKFLGAMALYAAMLAVTLIHFGVLFYLRQPGVEADR